MKAEKAALATNRSHDKDTPSHQTACSGVWGCSGNSSSVSFTSVDLNGREAFGLKRTSGFLKDSFDTLFELRKLYSTHCSGFSVEDFSQTSSLVVAATRVHICFETRTQGSILAGSASSTAKPFISSVLLTVSSAVWRVLSRTKTLMETVQEQTAQSFLRQPSGVYPPLTAWCHSLGCGKDFSVRKR